MSDRAARVIAATLALAGWAALALQLYLIVDVNVANGSGWLTGVSRYFGFFTILTNIVVAFVLSAAWLPDGVRRRLSTPGVRAAAAAYIAMVGIVYSIVLRALWAPEGAQKLADVVLHDLVPVLYVLYWLVFWRTGTLRWRVVPLWLVYPLGYLAYSLLRGAIAGWYPYPFIDAATLGYQQAIVNAIGITVAFTALCLLIIAMDRTGIVRSLKAWGSEA